MSRLGVLCCVLLAAAAARADDRSRPGAAPSGVRVVAQPSAPSLPLERKRVDRQRVVEQRLADGTVLAHLNGEGMAHSGLVIGPDGIRPVCGPVPDAAIDFRRPADGAGHGRR